MVSIHLVCQAVSSVDRCKNWVSICTQINSVCGDFSSLRVDKTCQAFDEHVHKVSPSLVFIFTIPWSFFQLTRGPIGRRNDKVNTTTRNDNDTPLPFNFSEFTFAICCRGSGFVVSETFICLRISNLTARFRSSIVFWSFSILSFEILKA